MTVNKRLKEMESFSDISVTRVMTEEDLPMVFVMEVRQLLRIIAVRVFYLVVIAAQLRE